MDGFNNSKLNVPSSWLPLWLLQCVIVLVIILTTEFRYTVVQHFIGLAYIAALHIIE